MRGLSPAPCTGAGAAAPTSGAGPTMPLPPRQHASAGGLASPASAPRPRARTGAGRPWRRSSGRALSRASHTGPRGLRRRAGPRPHTPQDPAARPRPAEPDTSGPPAPHAEPHKAPAGGASLLPPDTARQQSEATGQTAHCTNPGRKREKCGPTVAQHRGRGHGLDTLWNRHHPPHLSGVPPPPCAARHASACPPRRPHTAPARGPLPSFPSAGGAERTPQQPRPVRKSNLHAPRGRGPGIVDTAVFCRDGPRGRQPGHLRRPPAVSRRTAGALPGWMPGAPLVPSPRFRAHGGGRDHRVHPVREGPELPVDPRQLSFPAFVRVKGGPEPPKTPRLTDGDDHLPAEREGKKRIFTAEQGGDLSWHAAHSSLLLPPSTSPLEANKATTPPRAGRRAQQALPLRSPSTSRSATARGSGVQASAALPDAAGPGRRIRARPSWPACAPSGHGPRAQLCWRLFFNSTLLRNQTWMKPCATSLGTTSAARPDR